MARILTRRPRGSRAGGALLLSLSALVLLPGSASAALIGVERIGPATALTSSNKSITATCPAGKKVLGAAADVTPGDGHVYIDDISPNASLTSVTVNALEDEAGTSADWYVQAFAICAYPPPGLERVAATSPLNSTNKSITATCPAGKKVLGAGGDINSFVGEVLFDDLRPDAGLTNVTVNALEDETGNSTPWSLTAYAICANPVPGLVRTVNTSNLDSNTPKVTSSQCPAGKQVTGVGMDINTFNGEIVLDSVFPNAGVNGAGAGAFEDATGNTAPWSLTSYSICAPSQNRVVATNATNSGGIQQQDAVCAPGQQLTGTGADVTGGNGEVWIWNSSPNAALNDVTAYAEEDLTGYSRGWSLRAFGICSTPPAGLELRTGTTASGSGDSASSTATCPAGKSVLGGGAKVLGGMGHVSINRIAPSASLTSIAAKADEDPSGLIFSWDLVAYAICANTPAGLQRVVSTSEPDSDPASSLASCPAGKTLLGAGGEMNNGFGLVILDDLRPNDQLTNVTATGLEADSSYSSEWSVSAYAICANS